MEKRKRKVIRATQNLTRNVQVRLTPEEHAALERAAENAPGGPYLVGTYLRIYLRRNILRSVATS